MDGSALGAARGADAGAALAPGSVRTLACPSCGAPVVLRAMAWAQTVGCASCGAVLDAADPSLRVLQEAARRRGPDPLIPLGTRGHWRGAEVEVVGVREQEIAVDGVHYRWREYVLFNPYRGFRYLVEYDGHWTDVAVLRAVPAFTSTGPGRPAVRHGGEVYRHFQTATARTVRVLGEFPWEARVGDAVRAKDYVAPPRVLSAEEDGGEVTWSAGEYVDGDAVWRAFALPGRAPAARGVYATQPNPHARAPWALFALFAALLLAALVARFATAADAPAFRGSYQFTPGLADSAAAAAQAFVTPAFALGRGANVLIETQAAVDGQWMAVDYALVDEGTGAAYEAQRELGFYSGTDPDDGSRWTEGSRRDRVRLGPVPAGRYFLRVGPGGGDAGPPVAWSVTVRRDAPSPLLFLLGLVVVAVPPAWMALRRALFEQRRWAESDYAPSGADASDDDEEEG